MSATYYRKYRPSRFADVIGQETIVKTLENSLVYNRIAHAYLFTGPRGTGKTTLARLFAQAINCQKRKRAEPCGVCLPCTLQLEGRSLDIIEIDAASHTGVDNIRELKETVALSPTVGSHKVYIIDEAHMLSLGAWNALLKTLEEPPAHVVFILATTRIDKVPETILSRALRFDFSRFSIESIVAKLERIAQAEKIKIEKDALTLIARAAQGGMRDAEVIFTQITTLEESPINSERVALLLGMAETHTIEALLSSIANNDLTSGLRQIQALKNAGVNLSQLTLSLLDALRKVLFFSLDESSAHALTTELTQEEKKIYTAFARALKSERIILALERFQEASLRIKDTPIPELPLEIALAKLIDLPKTIYPTTLNKDIPPPQNNASKKTLPQEASTSKKTSSEPENTHPPINLDTLQERWPSIVELAKNLNASVAVALAAATPQVGQANSLLLVVKYPFHKERLEDTSSRLTLNKAFDTILGFRPYWRVEVETRSTRKTAGAHPPLLDQAIEILGGKLIQNES